MFDTAGAATISQEADVPVIGAAFDRGYRNTTTTTNNNNNNATTNNNANNNNNINKFTPPSDAAAIEGADDPTAAAATAVDAVGDVATEDTSASFSREKTLHEVLLQQGLHYIRPLGRGTFGRVVLARTGTLTVFFCWFL